MTALEVSAETRLAGLLERLLNAADASLAAGDLEPARAMAEETRAVDPDNRRATSVLRRAAARQLGPSGERALMTLLFSDLVGSTVLSEQVEPEQLRDLFPFYRAAAREAVNRYGGYVMHYSGDGILAGFGYPEPHEDDARRAVLAGLDLVTAMRDARPTPRPGEAHRSHRWARTDKPDNEQVTLRFAPRTCRGGGCGYWLPAQQRARYEQLLAPWPGFRVGEGHAISAAPSSDRRPTCTPDARSRAARLPPWRPTASRRSS